VQIYACIWTDFYCHEMLEIAGFLYFCCVSILFCFRDKVDVTVVFLGYIDFDSGYFLNEYSVQTTL
jgi:hypothetical protein